MDQQNPDDQIDQQPLLLKCKVPSCGFTCKTKQKMSKHKLGGHLNNEDDMKYFEQGRDVVCDVCGKKYKSVKVMKVHKNRDHKNLQNVPAAAGNDNSGVEASQPISSQRGKDLLLMYVVDKNQVEESKVDVISNRDVHTVTDQSQSFDINVLIQHPPPHNNRTSVKKLDRSKTPRQTEDQQSTTKQTAHFESNLDKEFDRVFPKFSPFHIPVQSPSEPTVNYFTNKKEGPYRSDIHRGPHDNDGDILQDNNNYFEMAMDEQEHPILEMITSQVKTNIPQKPQTQVEIDNPPVGKDVDMTDVGVKQDLDTIQPAINVSFVHTIKLIQKLPTTAVQCQQQQQQKLEKLISPVKEKQQSQLDVSNDPQLIQQQQPLSKQELVGTNKKDNNEDELFEMFSELQKSDSLQYRLSKPLQEFLNLLQKRSDMNTPQIYVKDKQASLKTPDAKGKCRQYNTRKNTKLVMDDQLKDSDSSITYGEITRGAVDQMIQVMGLDKNCEGKTFCDIGSGFGAVVTQVAVKCNVRALGIEIIKTRCDDALDVQQQFIRQHPEEHEFNQRLQGIEFLHLNAVKMQELKFSDGTAITHLYIFSSRMSDNDIEGLAELINKSPSIECFAWTKDSKSSIRNLGIQGFRYVSSHSATMKGSSQKFTFYIYQRGEPGSTAKTRSNRKRENPITTLDFQGVTKRLIGEDGVVVDNSVEVIIPKRKDDNEESKEVINPDGDSNVAVKKYIRPRDAKAQFKHTQQQKVKPDKREQALHMKELAYAIFTAFNDGIMHTIQVLLNQYLRTNLRVNFFRSEVQLSPYLWQLSILAKDWFYIKQYGKPGARIKQFSPLKHLSSLNDQIDDFFEVDQVVKQLPADQIQSCKDKVQLMDTINHAQHFEQGGKHYLGKLIQIVRPRYPGLPFIASNENHSQGQKAINDEQQLDQILPKGLLLQKEERHKLMDQYQIINGDVDYNHNVGDMLENVFMELLHQRGLMGENNKELKEAEDEIDYFISEGVQSSNYRIMNRVTKSGQARIYKCCRANDKQQSAVLALKVPIGESKLKQEIDAIDKIQNSKSYKAMFVVRVEEQLNIMGKICMLMPWYEYNLLTFIPTCNLNSNQILYLSYYIALGVSAGHDLQICHRDIKPENIMLDDKYIPKVCDWGFTDSSLQSGTTLYKAPEQHYPQNMKIDPFKLDSWNLGVVMYYIQCKDLPYSTTDYVNFMSTGEELKMDVRLSQKQQGLMKVTQGLLQINPAKRITIASAMKDGIFDAMKQVNHKKLNIKTLK